MLFTAAIHRHLHLLAIAIILVFLPFSEFVVSVGLFVLCCNWLASGCWGNKWARFKDAQALWLFLAIYLSLVIGMLYTENFAYGLKELRLKLPLLLVPLVMATSSPVTRKELLGLLGIFVLSTLAASFYSTYLLATLFPEGASNVRVISPFISHIRLSLMINIAVICCALLFIYTPAGFPPFSRWIALLVGIWLSLFIFILQSLTGFVVLGLIILFLFAMIIFRLKGWLAKAAFGLMGLAVGALATVVIVGWIVNFFDREQVDFSTLPTHTIGGAVYSHYPEKEWYENGYRVWINIAWDELYREWARRSSIPLDGIDAKGQQIKPTAIRYLTSLGLTKDSVGVAQLDSIDVALIESGVTSVIVREHRFGLYPRFYQMLWEIESYLTFGHISGSPLIHRLVYVRSALAIIRDHPILGVGTGDLIDAFHAHYRAHEPSFDPKHWFISHNQYLTQTVALGLLGLMLFLGGWVGPVLLERRYRDPLFLSIFLIISVSMLNEDTFQTHTGITLGAMFYGLLLFGRERDDRTLAPHG